MPLPYLDIHFTITVAGQAPDLPFLGPTVRGMLGHALRAHCCGHDADASGRCALGESCTYAYLFEAPVQRRISVACADLDGLPQPFLPLVDAPCASRSTARDLRFGVRLFGGAADLAPAVAAAVARREGFGFGARSHAFRVQEIQLSEVTAWRRTSGTSSEEIDEIEESVHAGISRARRTASALALPEGLTHLRFRFETPVALAGAPGGRGDWAARILDATARRQWLLESAYSPHGTPRPLPRESDTSGFKTVREDLSRFAFERRSTRHGGAVRLAGFVGELEISGPWHRHRTLLSEALVSGVGRSCSFGFGRIAVEVVGSATPLQPREREFAKQQDAGRTPTRDPSLAARLNTPRWQRLRGAPPAKRLP